MLLFCKKKMKSILLLCLIIVASLSVFAQLPATDEIKKMNIQSIKSNSEMVAKESLFDKNGWQTADLTEGAVNWQKTIFYNNNQKPDSIMSESSMSWSRFSQYYKYAADGSSVLQTHFKDYTDTLILDKNNRKVRQHSSDGSNIKYEYNTKMQLVKATYTDNTGGKLVEVFVYDSQGWLIKSTHTKDTSSAITTTYIYNAKGKILSEKSSGTGDYVSSGSSSTYLYNANNLLIKKSTVMGTLKYSENYLYGFYK